MQREKLIDDFFYNQPEKTFDKDLKEVAVKEIDFAANEYGYIKIENAYLVKGAFEKDSLLEPIYSDLERFLSFNKLNGKKYAFRLELDPSLKKEEFEISVTKHECEISASEREGIRRAIVRIEDLLTLNGGNLKEGVERIRFSLERRISRCFFTPINRAPKYTDELMDEIDYYPDGFLNRLMHDGVNAIWLSSDFASLIKSPYITEFGKDSERRIKKLNAVIDKCARYGIEVFLFMIEPISLFEPSVTVRFPEIYKKYPMAHGNNGGGPRAFCTYSEFGEKYLADSVERLFSSVPSLAGIISITFGERVTSCANTWGDFQGKWYNNCPYCKDKKPQEIVTHTVKIIVDSMKKVKPSAEFISWTYAHRGVPFGDIEEYVDGITDKAILMQNFEDNGRPYQLGKKRYALDYYLCYPGPSPMFEFTAESAKAHQKKLYAKMQICCSHELATMPYIPVPGLVYDKMKEAARLNVSGVMESWFFGNYPCLMSKAVGMLSSEDYSSGYISKKDFLLKLAGVYWKKERREIAVKAWEYFEKAYKNYPVNVMFNYYGPMHDGVVWELSLKPKNFSLPRSWQLVDNPDGDRIGECLFFGHTLDEAVTLCTEMRSLWQEGLKCLEGQNNLNEEEEEQVAVAEALGILFDSGLNILNFYKLRDDLGYGSGNFAEILGEMKEIVVREKENSRKMIPLCIKYNSFGYHSEAEGYKFFPEKLLKRIESLDGLLNGEFPEVENRVKEGLRPLPYYYGEEEGSVCYTAGRNGLASCEFQKLSDGKSSFKIAEDGDEIVLEIKSDYETNYFICNEFHLSFPQCTYIFSKDGEVLLNRDARSHQSILDERIDEIVSLWKTEKVNDGGAGTHIIARAKKDKVGFVRFPYKMMIRTFGGEFWANDKNPTRTLGKNAISPGDFGWIE